MIKNRWGILLVLVLTAILLVGCSKVASSDTTSTSPSSGFSTPKAGVWIGENGFFTLLNSGEISNLNWTVNKTNDGSTSACPVVLDQNIPVVDGIGDFTLKYKTGAVSFNIKVVFDSATTATLYYTYDMCPSTLTVSLNGAEGKETVKWDSVASN